MEIKAKAAQITAVAVICAAVLQPTQTAIVAAVCVVNIVIFLVLAARRRRLNPPAGPTLAPAAEPAGPTVDCSVDWSAFERPTIWRNHVAFETRWRRAAEALKK